MKRNLLNWLAVLATSLLPTSIFAQQADHFSARYFLPGMLELAELSPTGNDPLVEDAFCLSQGQLPGFLSIGTTESDGIHLFVEDHPIGTTACGSPAHFEVIPGKYCIEGRDPAGLVQWQQWVQVKPATVAQVYLDRRNASLLP